MKRGFTLLEVMVAMAILATALMVVFSHQATSMNLGNEARVLIKATLLAQEKMAELLAQGQLDMGTDTGEVEDGTPALKWKTSVEDSEQEGLMRVTVLVTWKARSKERDLEIATYVGTTQ